MVDVATLVIWICTAAAAAMAHWRRAEGGSVRWAADGEDIWIFFPAKRFSGRRT